MCESNKSLPFSALCNPEEYKRCKYLKGEKAKQRSHDWQALVTGANLLFDPTIFHLLSSQNFLSPDGRSYSFDERANGYARGEGVIAIVLKPVAAAVRDGDMIRAVIRASGSNQDGRTPIITQPSQQAQQELIHHVYKRANISLADTRYVEAHGKPDIPLYDA
jgi:acyl transferase domain-containing protein